MWSAAGRLVRPELFEARKPVKPVGLASMKAKRDTGRPPSWCRPPDSANETPVIACKPGLILTYRETAALEISETRRAARPRRRRHQDRGDRAARHQRQRRRSFVKGFGLKRGRIASSVGHDSHNITVVGANGRGHGGGGEPADRAGRRLRRRRRPRGRRTGAADRRTDERSTFEEVGRQAAHLREAA
jgi:adenine deaminase